MERVWDMLRSRQNLVCLGVTGSDHRPLVCACVQRIRSGVSQKIIDDAEMGKSPDQKKGSDLLVLKMWKMSRFNEEKSTSTSRSKKFRLILLDPSQPSPVQNLSLVGKPRPGSRKKRVRLPVYSQATHPTQLLKSLPCPSNPESTSQVL